jgi:nuclear-control-of-ATPase protein 2
MSYLFSSPPPSYASEQLHSHLSALSTLPINLPQKSISASSSAPDKPSSALESALHELSSHKLPSREGLKKILKSLVDAENGSDGFIVQSEIDRVVEGEVLGRAVTIVWKEVLDELMSAALQLDREREWWDNVLNSRQGVGIYLLQSEPASTADTMASR